MLDGFRYAPFNDLQALAAMLGPKTCAIMVEPVQGEGGVNVPSPDYLEGLRELCQAHQLLLIYDEVQCGIGRTGTLFAYEHEGVPPDIMTLAKSLAGGVPIGAILAAERATADAERITAAVREFADVTGNLEFVARNVIIWRLKKGLPYTVKGIWP